MVATWSFVPGCCLAVALASGLGRFDDRSVAIGMIHFSMERLSTKEADRGEGSFLHG